MILTLCSNCRLPINAALQRCPQCGHARRTQTATTRQVSVAAALAVVAAAVALVSRRAGEVRS